MLNVFTDNYNFLLVRGDTLYFGFEVQGNEEELSEYDFIFSCKSEPNSKEYIFQKVLNDGILYEGDNIFSVRVAPGDTENIDLGEYFYDLEMRFNGDVFTVLRGRIDLVQDITRYSNYE